MVIIAMLLHATFENLTQKRIIDSTKVGQMN